MKQANVILFVCIIMLVAINLGASDVTIGAGNQTALVPLDMYYKTSLFECLYYPDELGFSSGTVTALQFYNNFTTSNTNGATKIWLGSSTMADLSGGWIPSTQLTLVYDGTVTYPSGANTINIQLNTPYNHTAGNLVMMVLRPMDSVYYSSSDTFLAQTIGTTRSRKVRSDSTTYDPANPPETSTLSGQFPKTTIYYTGQAIANDLGCQSISGNLSPSVGITSNYMITVKNNGANVQSDYSIKLFNTDSIELASVPGPTIASQQVLQITVPWSPLSPGPASIYGMLQMDGDEIAANNLTESISIDVLSEGIQAVTIGAGNQEARIPVDMYYENSLFECLYYQDELGFMSGTITALQLYANFVSNIPNAPIKIWLGSTIQSDLASGYIPSSQLTLVYDGLVDFPSGANAVNIPLQVPFVHIPGNLILMVNRPMDSQYYSSSDYFLCQTIGTNRARKSQSSSISYDPANPPSTSTLSGQFPRIRFVYSEQIISNDLSALSILGTPTPSVGNPSEYIVKVRNNGIETQSDYSIRLFDANNVELASVPGPTVSSLQILEVAVPWTPNSEGLTTIYGKVVLSGDEIPANDVSPAITVSVQPAGVLSITIGAGDQQARMPVDVYYRNSLYECLYYTNEIGVNNVTITGLAFYNTFDTSAPSKPVKIWMGMTAQSDLSAGYIPSTQLTLVFDGVVNFPSGQNIIPIYFTTPFVYTGSNLVMMFNRPMDIVTYSSTNRFLCQTASINRTRNAYSNSPLSSSTPPEGTLTAQYPKTTLFYSTNPIQSDLVCLNLAKSSGATYANSGTSSNYRVQVKNNGQSGQSSYSVQLLKLDEAVLASVPGTYLSPGGSAYITVPWTPTTTGDIQIFARVVHSGDEYPSNNDSSILQMSIYEQGTGSITVASASTTESYPINSAARNSVSESIYLSSEIGSTPRMLTGLAYYPLFNTDLPNKSVKIWLGNTSLTDLSGGYVPAGTLVQVFEGSTDILTRNSLANFLFTNPFMYTGGNLIMLVTGDYYTEYTSSYNYFYYSALGSNRSLRSAVNSVIDPYQTNLSTTLSNRIPKTTFFSLTPGATNDLACLAVNGSSFVNQGVPSSYSISLLNNTASVLSGYTVKLMQTGGAVLNSIVGSDIDPGQTIQVSLPWTPSSSGSASIYGSVEMPGDGMPVNNDSPVLQVIIMNPNEFVSHFGGNDIQDRLPIDMYYNNSLFECMFYEDEIQIANGSITGIVLYNNFVSNLIDKPAKIWLGTTSNETLDWWIPSSSLTAVFDGVVDFPYGGNQIYIEFDTPFTYTGGNLILLVNRPWDTQYYSEYDNFYCASTVEYRTVYNTSNTEVLNPASYPSSYSSSSIIPKTSFVYTGQAITSDLGCSSITWHTAASIHSPSVYTVTVQNNTTFVQESYTVRIAQTNGTILSETPGLPINPGTSINYDISWQPAAAGPETIHGSVILPGDQIVDNNNSPEISITVYGDAVTHVGMGTDTSSSIPLRGYNPHSVSETVFTASEIGTGPALINGLGFYFNLDLYDYETFFPVSIWLANTNQADLSTGLVNSSQMVHVFQGYLSTGIDYSFMHCNFSTPFLYEGSNLIMLVIKSGEDFWGSFKGQTTSIYYKTRYLYGESAYDSTNLPSSSYRSYFCPQTTFLYDPSPGGEVSGTVYGPGNVPLTGTTVSVSGYPISSTTMADGAYEFQYIPVGSQQITASKEGYTTVNHDVLVTEDQQVVQDFSLALLPLISINGRIRGDDATALGVSGAIIDLIGDTSYSVVAEADGSFFIASIYGQSTYEYKVTAEGYYPFSGVVVVYGENFNLGAIILHHIEMPLFDVHANTSGNNVEIDWMASGSGGEWLHYCNGDPSGWISFGTSQPMTVAVRYTPANLQDYAGMSLHAVKLYSDGSYPLSLCVWTGGSQNNPGALVLEQTFMPNQDGDTVVELNNPVLITGSQELWFGYKQIVPQGWLTVGTDDTSTVLNGYSNLLNMGDGWTTLSDYWYDNYNWYLKGYVGFSAPLTSRLTGTLVGESMGNYLGIDPSKLIISERSKGKDKIKITTLPIHYSRSLRHTEVATPSVDDQNRSLNGYKIWRLEAGQESNVASWTELTTEPITPSTFIDVGWVDCGVNINYVWAVKSVYSNGVLSLPAFSNSLTKPYMAPQIVQSLPNINIQMNNSFTTAMLSTVFSSPTPALAFSLDANPHVSGQLNPDTSFTLTPQQGWYGVEYLSIRATDSIGQYCIHTVRITVLQTDGISVDFNLAGSLPTGWSVTGTGSTTFPWQPVQISGSNYAMKTMATTGTTANERLLSPAYSFSNRTNVTLTFDSDFLPYGNGTGTFAYTLNNITYTVVETFSTAQSGAVTYSLPALNNKPMVKFRWTYLNTQANVAEVNYWIVDNISLSWQVVDVIPPATIAGLDVIGLSITSATLGWSASSEEFFDRYEIYYSTDSVVDTSDQLWTLINDPALGYINTVQTTITGLSLGEYWASIRAIDQNGNVSPLSATASFLIEGSAPVFSDPIPGGQPLPAWSISRIVSIGATINDLHNIDHNNLTFRYDRNCNGTYDTNEVWQNIPPYAIQRSQRNSMSFSFEVDFLSDGSGMYEFSVTDIVGNIAYSGFTGEQGVTDDWTVRIDTISPVPINNFFVQTITDNSIQLTWAASSDLNFVGYRIFYSTSPNVGSSDELWDWIDDPALSNEWSGFVSTIVTGLNSATRYYFLLEAIDEVGWVAQFPSVITAMTTSSAPPQTPQNLSIIVQGQLLLLDWDDVTLDTQGNPITVDGYQVYVGDTPDFECNNDSLIATVSVSNLTLEDVVEYVDRLFLRIIANSGSIRTERNQR